MPYSKTELELLAKRQEEKKNQKQKVRYKQLSLFENENQVRTKG